MRVMAFSRRNAREILRDPLNLVFGLGFPVILLLLLSAIQASIPVSLFEIESLAPAMTVFGLAFMTLFSATLVSRDRETAFLSRLYTTPLRASDFIIGYLLPFLPIALMQCAICYAFSFVLGLLPSVNILLAIFFEIPSIIFFTSLGLLFGSLLSVKQVGGICGALLTNLTAWLSGIWFDLELVGGWFFNIAKCLPFVHSVQIQRSVASGEFGDIFIHLAVVCAYAVFALLISILVFLRQMKK